MQDPIPMQDIVPLTAKTLTPQVRDGIRGFIINNQLTAGSALPSEATFAQRFGVSRTVVREAVQSLQTMGILEARRGHGLFVKQFSFAPLVANLPYGLLSHRRPLEELLEIRELLETALVDRVIDSQTEEALAPAREDLEQMRAKAERGELFQEEDRSFHQHLFSLADNQTLLELLDVFWLAFRESSLHTQPPRTDPMVTYERHVAIFEAIVDRDPQRTRDAVNRHYDDIETRLRDTPNRTGNPSEPADQQPPDQQPSSGDLS